MDVTSRSAGDVADVITDHGVAEYAASPSMIVLAYYAFHLGFLSAMPTAGLA